MLTFSERSILNSVGRGLTSTWFPDAQMSGFFGHQIKLSNSSDHAQNISFLNYAKSLCLFDIGAASDRWFLSFATLCLPTWQTMFLYRLTSPVKVEGVSRRLSEEGKIICFAGAQETCATTSYPRYQLTTARCPSHRNTKMISRLISRKSKWKSSSGWIRAPSALAGEQIYFGVRENTSIFRIAATASYTRSWNVKQM